MYDNEALHFVLCSNGIQSKLGLLSILVHDRVLYLGMEELMNGTGPA